VDKKKLNFCGVRKFEGSQKKKENKNKGEASKSAGHKSGTQRVSLSFFLFFLSSGKHAKKRETMASVASERMTRVASPSLRRCRGDFGTMMVQSSKKNKITRRRVAQNLPRKRWTKCKCSAAWNNDDHEEYSSSSSSSSTGREGQDIGSVDEGDMFEGETYLRASESLQEKTKRHEEENGPSTHVLPSLLFPVSEPIIPGQRKVLHLYEPRFVSLLNDSVDSHGGLMAFVHYSQIPPSCEISTTTSKKRVWDEGNDDEEEKSRDSSNVTSNALADRTEQDDKKKELNQRPLPNERDDKLEMFGDVYSESDSDASNYEEEFEKFSEFARQVNSRYGDESGFGTDEEDDEDEDEDTQAVQLNATCTLGRIIQYEPIKILSNDGFDDGVTIDIVDEYGESSGTFGETYRVLVVGETRMMVEDVNETPAGYVAGTYSLVNSPDSKFAVQPTEDERNQIEQLADDVELLMNYVIEFGDSLLKVSNMTKETLFDDVVRKAEAARDYPTEIHRKFAIEEAKMLKWAKSIGKVDSLHESMKWVEEDGIFFDAKIELENVARMNRDQDKAGLSLDDAILSRLRRSAALTMAQNEEDDEEEMKIAATDVNKRSRASAMVRAERLSFAAFQEVPFASADENEKLIARRAAAMSSSVGLLDRLRLAKSGLEEQLGGLRAKLALEKSLRATLDGGSNDTNTDNDNKKEEGSDENENDGGK